MKLHDINTNLSIKDVVEILNKENLYYKVYSDARNKEEHEAGLDTYLTIYGTNYEFDIIPNMGYQNDKDTEVSIVEKSIKENLLCAKTNFNPSEVKDSIVKWIKDIVGDCTVVIGISGGTDSSVVAALCVEALGKDKVFGVLMPDGEQQDIDKSEELVRHLGINYRIINIGNITKALRKEFNWEFFGELINNHYIYENNKLNDVYETNTPARIRMTTLYGVAAILGNSRVVNTCNLSEDFVGYSTKFGDSAGDFSPLAMITKTEVKQLGYALGLPKDLIEKVPSDGMSGMSDEEKLGFTYIELDTYIRTGKIEDLEHKAKIDRLHKMNLHKIEPMPKFKLPIVVGEIDTETMEKLIQSVKETQNSGFVIIDSYNNIKGEK